MVDALLLLVLVFACTIQSAFGFGLALIAVPLLSTVLPLSLVTPLLALLSMTLGGTVAWQTRNSVQVELLWKLLAAAAAGVPAGIALVIVLDGDIVQLGLGLVVVFAALHGLSGAGVRNRLHPQAVWPFGFVAGVLGGAWNLMGPPLVLFLRWSGLDPAAYRSTLHAVAFVTNVLIVGGWLLVSDKQGGASVFDLGRWFALALLPLLVGGWAGGALARRIDTDSYWAAVHCLLLVTGIGLIVATFATGCSD